MATDFKLITEIKGYVTKPDKTNTDERTLVSGSLNTLINEQEKLQVRDGYTLQSAADTSNNPIQGAYDWVSTTGVLNVRSYDDELEVYVGTVDGVATNAWKRIKDSWSAVDFVFDSWWNNTELQDQLIFVNGDSNIYMWSGGIAIASSATTNTITKKGTTTFGENRFFGSANLSVTNVRTGNSFTYTGGDGTTTLTGVSPDPSSDIQDGDILVQTVVTNTNKPTSGLKNDTVRVLNNQAWYGSNTSRIVYVSTTSDYTAITESTPRVPGQGATLTLDNVTNGFAVFGQDMVVFSGRSDIYKSQFEQLDVSGTLTETLKVKKIKTSINQSAQSQALITEMGDSVAFITYEPALRILSDIESIQNPQTFNYSNEIKPDFDSATFTNGDLFFDTNRIYLALPSDNRVYILQLLTDADGNQRRFWQPPQVLPVRRWSIISNAIHGHSSTTAETYKLFDGTNDNAQPINGKAVFAYRTHGDRFNLKTFDKLAVEGYIRGNTVIDVTVDYEYQGSRASVRKTIDGSDTATTFGTLADGSLGMESLGTGGLGVSDVDSESDLLKFRRIIALAPQDCAEYQITLETNDVDYQWELLAIGTNAKLSPNKNTKIVK